MGQEKPSTLYGDVIRDGTNRNIHSNKMSQEFVEFPKMARLSRDSIITEKIDGTNGQIRITDDGEFLVGSRTRWITPQDDNHGFARWCYEHKDELLTLGPGSHFGEWWGAGIRRKYGLKEKRFSLFNVSRWCLHGNTPQIISQPDAPVVKYQDVLPPCCGLVPVLYKGLFTTNAVDDCIAYLVEHGSQAAPGFKDPEGLVVYHTAAQFCFKKTIKNDESPKSKV